MNLPAFRALARPLAAFALAAAATQAFAAGPVVVGRYDPSSGLAYTMENVYVSSFADGTPITKFAIGYSQPSKAYYLLRAGQPKGGGCRKEVFRLVPISGNRLAIADPNNINLAWGVNPIPTRLYATFDCTSATCMDCVASDGTGSGVGSLEEPYCVCSPVAGSAGQGECTTNKPGTGGPYGVGAIVIQAPTP